MGRLDESYGPLTTTGWVLSNYTHSTNCTMMPFGSSIWK
ncbi:Uncharacterised protein [Mycobacteroides abscessus subsp. abscessus]|nr:Uncharacterised protein [Mycobacteroides abscessus subsp. abscessus]